MRLHLNRIVPGLIFATLLCSPASAAPFHGPLNAEVEVFLGSYAFVSARPGASAETIRAAAQRCKVQRPAAKAPPAYAGGKLAVYLRDGALYAEGASLSGETSVMAISDDVVDVRSNFRFQLSTGDWIEVELAHFHRDDEIWPGVLMTGGAGFDGTWVTCASEVKRPFEQ